MTDFQKACYNAVRQVPFGKVTTYAEIAQKIGHPRAYRAVGTAMKYAPNDPELPCHRVIKTNGEVGEFLSGKDVKIDYLLAEGILVKNGKVVNLAEHLLYF